MFIKTLSLVFLAGCIFQFHAAVPKRGTLLMVDGHNSWAHAGGQILLLDLKTGDTVKFGESVGQPQFSPNGRNIVYCSGTWESDGQPGIGYLKVLNLRTRQTRTLLTIPQSSIEPYSWFGFVTYATDSTIYFARYRWILRYNLNHDTLDSIYLVKGYLSSADSTIPWEERSQTTMCEGGVSADGTRATLEMDDMGAGMTFAIDIVKKTEVHMGPGELCQTACSPDGRWSVMTNHSVNMVRLFQQPDSAYREILASPSGNLWLNFFSQNSSNLLFYHTVDNQAVYVWQLDVNRYDYLTDIGNGWHFFPSGWVLDTIPPSAPSNLRLANAAGHAITLAWSAPASGLMPTGYVISRNGVEIGETENTTFTDSGLVEGMGYDYAVCGRTNGIVFSSTITGRYSTTSDNEPPRLLAAYSIGNSVDLYFSEPLETASATNALNYSLSGVSITAASLQGKNRVHLTTNVFSSLTDSFVHVTGIKDLAATPNTIVRDSIPVTLIRNLTTSSVEWTFLQTGVKYAYDDADIQIAKVQGLAPGMAGLPMLQTSVNDVGTDANTEFIRFTISRPMEILVATDSPLDNVPAWLKEPSWRRTGEFIEQWNIYSRVFPAGTVSLKGNGNASVFCYDVLLRPIDSSRLGTAIDGSDSDFLFIACTISVAEAFCIAGQYFLQLAGSKPCQSRYL